MERNFLFIIKGRLGVERSGCQKQSGSDALRVDAGAAAAERVSRHEQVDTAVQALELPTCD